MAKLMKFKINIGANTENFTTILKIDYYKTDDAYFDPFNHPSECFNIAGTIDPNISLSDLLKTIEMYINHLLHSSGIK